MRIFSFILSVLSLVFGEILHSEEGGNQKIREVYMKMEVQYNWTMKFSEKRPFSPTSLPKDPYFLVTKQDGFIVSVEYYNSQGVLTTGMFDPLYQISFSKATLEYIPGKGRPQKRLRKMKLFDFMGIPTGFVQYNWDNKKIEGRDGNIRSCALFQYSSGLPRGFFPKEKRSFIFGGDALGDDIGRVTRYNSDTLQKMEDSFYEGGKLIKRETYDIYNKNFSTQSLSYSFGKIKDKSLNTGRGVPIRPLE